MTDDAISRRAAIKWIKIGCNPYGKPILDYKTSCRIIEHLEKMNSVLPNKKTGKWKRHYEVLEKTSEYVISASGYECSECGTIFHNQWDFCGNCGAVMEKADEN